MKQNNKMKYVIIGNSTAATAAVEGIRKIDKQGEITVISGEAHHTYSRPLISYLLAGKVTQEGMKYRDNDFYVKNGVRLLYATAKSIDAKGKQVILTDGNSVPYTKLLAATGSAPFVPPFEGLDTVNNKVTFMSLDDARKLEEMLDENKRVLIVGGGLIGLKCAEGILERAARAKAASGKAARVTVVDMAPRILSSILDEGGAAMVQKHLESRGVEFRLSTQIKKFNSGTAVLENGETLSFDILVLAVGVRPNTALLNGVADIDRGVNVNEKSQTSAPDIYAAGDCTQTLDVSSGQRKIMALLPNAYIQGECAGINMAGGEKIFDRAIPMNAIRFFGLNIITAGNYSGETYLKNENGNYKRLFYSGNKLNGFIMTGNVEKAGIYTSLIRERTPLDTIDFALVCEKPGLMAFTKEDRMAKLGMGELS